MQIHITAHAQHDNGKQSTFKSKSIKRFLVCPYHYCGQINTFLAPSFFSVISFCFVGGRCQFTRSPSNTIMFQLAKRPGSCQQPKKQGFHLDASSFFSTFFYTLLAGLSLVICMKVQNILQSTLISWHLSQLFHPTFHFNPGILLLSNFPNSFPHRM